MAGTVAAQGQRSGLLPHYGQPFDFENTLLSGQAFRWRKRESWYEGVILGHIVRVCEVEGGIAFATADDDGAVTASRLRDYFSLDIDLQEVYSALSRHEALQESLGRYRGMRVLRQDPWETTLSFLCAQNSNVLRITRNIEDMCRTFGSRISLGDLTRHAYPTPEALAEAGEQALRALGLGYRARYVVSVAQKVARGDVDLTALRDASYADALETLMTLDGVGDKVANCIMLFSMDKPQAFPVDTHIRQVLRDRYPRARRVKSSDIRRVRAWAQEYFAPYAGYANHYLFHSRRVEGGQ
ncbi:MAG: DNA glycosylase [Chloroflexi bacterium]|nr:DNA glycosylase [Chloroflexota bacterium]